MPVPPYGTSSDVNAHVPRALAFSGTTKPTDGDVTTWLTRVSSRFEGALRGAGFDPTPLHNSGDGQNIVVDAVVRYVAATALISWAAASGREPPTEVASLQAPFLELANDLRERPSEFALKLGLAQPSVAGAGYSTPSSLRSFHTDDPDASDTLITPDSRFKVGGRW